MSDNRKCRKLVVVVLNCPFPCYHVGMDNPKTIIVPNEYVPITLTELERALALNPHLSGIPVSWGSIHGTEIDKRTGDSPLDGMMRTLMDDQPTDDTAGSCDDLGYYWRLHGPFGAGERAIAKACGMADDALDGVVGIIATLSDAGHVYSEIYLNAAEFQKHWDGIVKEYQKFYASQDKGE